MTNRKSFTGFPTSHHWRFCAAPNFPTMGIKYLNLSCFIQVSTIKDEKSAAKLHYIKTDKNCQRQSYSAINCLSSGINILAAGRPLPPEILAETDPPPPEGSEFWHILPCSASTVRDWRRSLITLNKNSKPAFQRAINQGSMPPLTSSKWG